LAVKGTEHIRAVRRDTAHRKFLVDAHIAHFGSNMHSTLNSAAFGVRFSTAGWYWLGKQNDGSDEFIVMLNGVGKT
jgi:hypothetical protein